MAFAVPFTLLVLQLVLLCFLDEAVRDPSLDCLNGEITSTFLHQAEIIWIGPLTHCCSSCSPSKNIVVHIWMQVQL